MLEDIKTKRHPIMLDPLLVHQKVDFPAFNYFANTLISLNKDLKKVLSFGTDGDKAIVEALAHNFPYAIQLRCFLHLKKNVEHKLLELGLPSSVSQEFLNDIFGKRSGNTQREGLVDSFSSQDFMERLEALKPVWDTREGPFAPSSGPRFFSHFLTYQADVVQYHMRKDLRESAGLGSPPCQFTTNASESINAVIKREVDYKESGWPEFNQKMRRFVESQREEITRALSGWGQYRLTPQFSHLGVPAHMWMKMSTEQRRDCISTFEKTRLSRASVTPCEEPVHSSNTSDCAEHTLSVSAEDSGITTIPLVTLNSMWVKASELLSQENAITLAPGSDPKARMVISKSQLAPHHVRSLLDHWYVCDSNCLQWFSSQICSHTVAVAECNSELVDFLDRYVRSGHTPNLSSVAFCGMPRGRGQKGGRPKRQRTRKNLPPPDNYMSGGGIAYTPSVGNSEAMPDHNITITQSPQLTVTGVYHPSSFSTSCSFVQSPHSPAYLSKTPPVQPSNQVQAPEFQSPLTQFQFPTYSSQSMIGQNTNPFYLKKLSGNIRICQGCRGSLRLASGVIPNPPHDIVVARLEKRQYHDPSGVLKTPAKPSAAHYHPRLSCIKAANPTFVPVSLHIPSDIRLALSFEHIQLLQVELGVYV